MLDDTKGKILIGGEVDEADNFIDITVVQVNDINDSMIVDESFGPLMPILPIDSVEEAIRIANTVHSTPLGFYPFGNKAETNKSKLSFLHVPSEVFPRALKSRTDKPLQC